MKTKSVEFPSKYLRLMLLLKALLQSIVKKKKLKHTLPLEGFSLRTLFFTDL